ncbi:hypothetical protein COV17_00470 [Candidatus Woesearchaeota archaeon CG10_big_fil_rev_8_21_14_0_10_36_11]|nr:MAG: hypothetical protein COV17_00470 [Candidatus Woesearchaeota archaeon CG10_big_fil_rev_8_21_14_0_10_36_11]
MFKLHGYIGIILIIMGEILMFYRWEPFSTYLFFTFLWVGFIFFVDALVYHRSGTSRFINHQKQFWLLFVISSLFWWFYELLNIFIDNWRYENVGQPEWLVFTVAFSTVLPAVFEASDFLSTFIWFDKIKFKLTVTNKKISGSIFIGIFALILPFVLPKYTFSLVWISMFFLLDPINYRNKQPSIIGFLQKGKPKLLFTLMFGTLLCGILWEFWNYWAPAKWYYFVPFVGFFKIFEMPILGFLGYLPFGLSLYAMYNFFISLFRK